MARSKAKGAELVPAGDLRAELAGLDPRQMEFPAVKNPWLLYLASQSETSRKSQAASVRTVFESLWGWSGPLEHFPWHLLEYGHLLELRSWLEMNRAPSTANKVLCAVRGSVRHGWLAGAILESHYRHVSAVRGLAHVALPAGRRLTDGELRGLFGVCDGQIAIGARDAAMLALGYGCGCRRAELVKLELSDLDLEQQEVRVTGKRRKQRIVPMPWGTVRACRAWLEHRGDAAGPLFWPTNGGALLVPGPMSKEGVQARITGLAVRAKVPRFTPHDLRRTFVTNLLDAGADLAIVADLAGHAALDTTKRYDRRDDAAKRRASDLLHVPFGESEPANGS